MKEELKNESGEHPIMPLYLYTLENWKTKNNKNNSNWDKLALNLLVYSSGASQTVH